MLFRFLIVAPNLIQLCVHFKTERNVFFKFQILLYLQSQVVYSVEDNEHILSLINQPLDILSKIGLIIKVKKPIYKWDNLPYAKCVFYDCKQHTDIMDSNPVRAHEMAREFWKNAHDNRNAQGIHRIIAEPGVSIKHSH